MAVFSLEPVNGVNKASIVDLSSNSGDEEHGKPEIHENITPDPDMQLAISYC